MGMGRGTRALSGVTAMTAMMLAALVPAAVAHAGGTPAPSSSGGSEYGAALTRAKPVRPRASLFTVSPRTVVSPRLPRLRVRIDQPGARTVRARIVFIPRTEIGSVARIELGRVATGRRIAVAWPSGSELAPGRYLVRLHVRGRGNAVLARSARASGRTTVVVRAPKPPAAAPPAAPAAQPIGTSAGVFPVAGAHAWGDGFGAARTGYGHQGQDIAAAAGTPVVSPMAGTVLYVDNQPSAAGWYVVLRGADGRDMFFAHCLAGSIAVRPGQAVSPAQPLCAVGATGRATGPHLHFEIWLGGWRVNAASRPIDPAADLRAWGG